MTRHSERPRIDVCLGFDGSTSSDWTGIRLETYEGWLFTPRYGPDRLPTAWNPAVWGGRIPRHEVRAAMTELYTTYRVERGYFDPRDWRTEIDEWALEFGSEHVSEWDTGGGSTRITVVHAMLERFVTDLTEGSLTHDGCPITAVHVANARKLAKPGEKYILGKPSEDQKIDMAMASGLAHEAAADARAAGWQPTKTRKRMIVRR
ncbi:MAG: 13 protein [Actinomycetia bacterium]|nr:13 protein [Actinomycetes bacterium]